MHTISEQRTSRRWPAILVVALVGAGVAAYLLLRSGPEASLQDAADACNVGPVTAGVEIGDEGRSMTIDGLGDGGRETAGGLGQANLGQITCVLDELGTPDAVISQMEGTRALDGMQSAEWDSYTATWTYHPDDGLDLIIQAT